MSNSLTQPAEFSSLIQRFFSQRLLNQRNASPRTVAAYRDTFRLFFKFVEQSRKKKPSDLTLQDFDVELVLEFLDYLEEQRKNSVRSRNLRLTTIHSFARYVALQCPPALGQAQQILAIPTKRFEKPMVGFLSREEIQALLSSTDPTSWTGRRDKVLLSVLYNTGARVSELIGILVSDTDLSSSPSIRLRGKGRKQRTIPLWKETAKLIRGWLKQEGLNDDQPLLPNRHKRKMTRSNVAERLLLAAELASKTAPQLKQRRVTPHVIRHTTAMHMLQSGVDITVIALWLGHESPLTTHGYVELDISMKQKALDATSPPNTRKTRYHASDSLLDFLNRL
jgi:integrase/recombinase XerD